MATWRGIHGIFDPPLFMKFNISKSGYSVHLTDLNRVWTEALSRREVIRRAVIDACSVDPTESDDQYGILLEKINDALIQAPKTRLSICKRENDGQLLLRLTAVLPKPLPPFRWDLHLSFQTDHSIADELVMPLLRQASELRRQVNQLVHEIAVKDSVIFKITDRLENSGQDLSLVFPNVSNLKLSRKKSQREQFSPHVKGLAEFDFAAWQANQDKYDTSQLNADLINVVFQNLPPAEDDHADNDWWLTLPTTEGLAATAPDSMQSNAAPKELDHGVHGTVRSFGSRIDDDDTAQDDFQKQTTPPHLRSRIREPIQDATKSFRSGANTSLDGGRAQSDPGEETATEDEDDDIEDSVLKKKPRLDGQEDQLERVSMSAVEVPSRVKKPGAIGEGINVAVSSQNPSENEHPQQEDGFISGSSASFNNIRDAKMVSTTGHNIRQASSNETFAGSKISLGNIGDRSNHASNSQTSTTLSHPPVPKTVTKKLGTIGGGRERHTQGESASRAQIVSDVHLPPESREGLAASSQHEEGQQTQRETSEERANIKREELRRDIEAKAKAPAKKKRKF
ncbi:XLF-domain-containing protein [Polychaeton citri CBS 116435]|uniref:Non-homologous end-joining factor 1 n=1 Tax=Polychaeton citri CBS 116435 TaxID=1314669 RepID=A0A9P4USW6_9PEZI|nr:XLF-domain-containing protein [Polychaeton citri CBS 116435]